MNTKVNHTPGPWMVINIGDQWKPKESAVVCNLSYKFGDFDDAVISNSPTNDLGFYEAKANAKLIAAAPELLIEHQNCFDLLAEVGRTVDGIEDSHRELFLKITKQLEKSLIAIKKAT
jgi:hypothetical protein